MDKSKNKVIKFPNTHVDEEMTRIDDLCRYYEEALTTATINGLFMMAGAGLFGVFIGILIGNSF